MITDTSVIELAFAPLLSPLWMWVLAALGSVLLFYMAYFRPRGGVLRLVCFLILYGYVANPSMLVEQRQPVEDTVTVVVDRSISQNLGDRADVATAITTHLETELDNLGVQNVRWVETDGSSVLSGRDGTNLMSVTAEAIGDIRADQVAGVILVTDGQVHDLDLAPQFLEDIPLHAILTGEKNESDRQVTFGQVPRFGVVGDSVEVSVQVSDTADTGVPVPVFARFGDGTVEQYAARVGEDLIIEVPIRNGGANVFEVSVPVRPDELTDRNNISHVVIEGVRDRLRVLLISGVPHAGERVWRNLLKSDPAVDLVHFTILRPPSKRDGAPVQELSLIAFPTRQLFRDRLKDFDLIIFDRYSRQGVLSATYFSNMAEYVQEGGSVLVAAGPSLASPLSLHRSPLAEILPVEPTSEVIERGFRPQVTDAGWAHPITSDLALQYHDPQDQPIWGRWYRVVETDVTAGETLMSDEDGNPLVVVNRVGEGRVAQVLSDHMWLWSRGVDGGGPQTELLRRLAHWLMREPELEEENLQARVEGTQIMIESRSLSDDVTEVSVTPPADQAFTVGLSSRRHGVARASVEADFPGLYRVNAGDQSTVVSVGRANPKEFEDMRTTQDILQPLLAVQGGGAFWATDGMPRLRRVSTGGDIAGRDWLGLRDNRQYVVTGSRVTPLFPGWLALMLALSVIGFTWYRESRS